MRKGMTKKEKFTEKIGEAQLSDMMNIDQRERLDLVIVEI